MSTLAEIDAMPQSTLKEVKAKLAAMQELAKEVGKAERSAITYKVSEKGALSTYGLGRFPVTLYLEQAERYDADVENRKAFIAAHRTQFSTKNKPVEAPAAK